LKKRGAADRHGRSPSGLTGKGGKRTEAPSGTPVGVKSGSRDVAEACPQGIKKKNMLGGKIDTEGKVESSTRHHTYRVERLRKAGLRTLFLMSAPHNVENEELRKMGKLAARSLPRWTSSAESFPNKKITDGARKGTRCNAQFKKEGKTRESEEILGGSQKFRKNDRVRLEAACTKGGGSRWAGINWPRPRISKEGLRGREEISLPL